MIFNYENNRADNRNSSSGNLGSPRMTSPPPLMSPPPADFHFHEKTPVKLNGVLSKSKGKDSYNGESKHIQFSNLTLLKYRNRGNIKLC